MGFGSFLFGQKGGFESFNNPYIDQANNTPFADFRGPRNYYKSILGSYRKGDYSNMPGMGQFDQAIARSNREIDESASPLAYTSMNEAGSPLAARIKELNKQRAQEGINSQRFGYAGDQLNNAAQGLFNIANARNQFNLQKNLGVAGLYNQTFTYRQPTQGAFGQILGSAIGAFAGNPFAGKGGGG